MWHKVASLLICALEESAVSCPTMQPWGGPPSQPLFKGPAAASRVTPGTCDFGALQALWCPLFVPKWQACPPRRHFTSLPREDKVWPCPKVLTAYEGLGPAGAAGPWTGGGRAAAGAGQLG